MVESVYIVNSQELDIILEIIRDNNAQNGIVFSDSQWLCDMTNRHFPKLCVESDFDESIIEAFLKYQCSTERSEIGVIVMDNYIDDDKINWMVENLHSYNILLIMTMDND